MICKKKKIMMLIPRMGNGGAERVMATLANSFADNGNKVLLISLTSDESFYELSDNVDFVGTNFSIKYNNPLIRQASYGYFGFKSIIYINKKIKRFEPDFLISFLTHANLLSIILKFFNRKLKLIISERAEPNARNLITKLVTRKFYIYADAIVCQSQRVKNFFPESSHKRIKIIENPINEESLPNSLPSHRRKNIVAVGRLFKQKNFSMLIESFANISHEFPDYNLEIYGEGPLRRELENKINKLNLDNRVFLMGIKKNVMKYVYDSEVFVLSSNFEGFPNVLIEAMASGMPVISTDFSTGVAKSLISDKNGIVIPTGDCKALSEALRILLKNEDLRTKMSYENIKIKKKLSIDKIIDKWNNLFESLDIRNNI